MKDYDSKRVIWYGPNDVAVGWAKDRIAELLLGQDVPTIKSIDDAIEALQCKLTVEGAPGLFEEESLPLMCTSAKRAYGEACKYVNSALAQTGLQALLDQTGQQYLAQFWRLLGACRAEKQIEGWELKNLLIDRPHCLSYVLEMSSFVRRFDSELKDAMTGSSRTSAELIVDRLATVQSGDRKMYLPQSLTRDDIDQIMLAYIGGVRPNSNILDVLSRWPNREVSRYKPSPDVQIAAKRAYDAAMQSPHPVSVEMKYGIGVSIDMEQKGCRGVKVEGLNLTYTYSGQWLENNLDSASILNNCIHLFDFIDNQGLLLMAGHKHDESAIMAAFGPKVLGEYRTSLAATRRGITALAETVAYEDFLARHGESLEAALEWAYNIYFHDELGVDGFGISLPPVDATWLDRCKGIGSEIERAMKTYQLFQEYGLVEADRFPFEQFKTFSAARTLSSGHKYAVAGDAFELWASALFSDQSLLVYPQDRPADDACLCDLMLAQNISRKTYKEPFVKGIDQLLEFGLIGEDSITGRLLPTGLARCLKLVWDSGAITLKQCSESGLEAIDDLVGKGVLTYSDGLFTPDEASYLNYMLNDSEASNSIGLRNKYAHANGPVTDPNSNEMRSDYHTMLALFISITLKINEELMGATGKGGLDPDGLADWPLYDASVYEAAERLGRE